MKISYRREMKHNYMIINPEEINWRGYECQMMEGNAIEGLLRFRLRQSNGETQFYYEITSRQPLGRMLESRAVTGEEIRRLVIGISNILDQMERFLLNESSVLLEPDYIYVEPEAFRVWLCLVPGLGRDFPDAYAHLLEYILGKVNHQDKDSVVLAYGLYQETQKENYGMEDILRLLRQNPASNLQERGHMGGRGGEVEQMQAAKHNGQPGKMTPTTTIPIRAAEGYLEEDREGGGALSENKNIWAKLRAFFMGKRRQKQETPPNPLPWQAMFIDEDEFSAMQPYTKPPGILPNTISSAMPSSMLSMVMPIPAEKQEEALQEPYLIPSHPLADFLPTDQDTVLLTDFSPREAVRKLHALDDGETDITIAYYPFIIGKQENLADYVLNHETVSRLHLRIDRIEAGYQIMDLNSTNGTIVRGNLLENNEMVALHPGDEVQIAKFRYRFE